MKRLILVLLICYGRSGLSQQPDIVINEILFNPARDGYDYIELYNRGNSVMDLDELLIANRNSTGNLASVRPFARGPTLLQSQQFCLITTNAKWVDMQYGIGADVIVCELSAMPSFPDEEGTVVILMRSDSLVVDELSYSVGWHFEVIDDPEGVSLERINYISATQDRNNWASAASSYGYGTPGRSNSQHRNDPAIGEGEINVLPKVFSPDNDGVDDYAFIVYQTAAAGMIANITIYDLAGRKIRYLIRNQVMGSTGQFKWDGLDDRGRRVANGMYVVVVETYDQRGTTTKRKEAIVIIGKG